MPTAYHSKYWAHALTLRAPSDSLEKLTRSLANARVDLNPHQVNAALFAFRSPLSQGAILADEVGLGKTIEAGDRDFPTLGRAAAQDLADRAGHSS